MKFKILHYEDGEPQKILFARKIEKEFPRAIVRQRENALLCSAEIAAFNPDVIVSDFHLSHSTLLEFIHRFKASGKPILIYTSDSPEETKRALAKELGTIPSNIYVCLAVNAVDEVLFELHSLYGKLTK